MSTIAHRPVCLLSLSSSFSSSLPRPSSSPPASSLPPPATLASPPLPQAVMASRMGVKVAMVACLGDDSFGESYLENLASHGIDCGSVRRAPKSATGVAQICVEDGGGANFIVIVPGANNLLSPEDVAAATDRLVGAKVVMVREGGWRSASSLFFLEKAGYVLSAIFASWVLSRCRNRTHPLNT